MYTAISSVGKCSKLNTFHGSFKLHNLIIYLFHSLFSIKKIFLKLSKTCRLELKEEYAWNFLVDITKQFPGEITLVAIGRMTLIFILEIFDILTASQFENYTIQYTYHLD